MGEVIYFDDPKAYLAAVFLVVGVYVLIILAICIWRRLRPIRHEADRQGNVFTIHDETNRDNRFNDIFFIEPNHVEAARIRAQLEKDEKDLPSYEEVMRMANLSSPTAAPASDAFATPAVSAAASSSSVNTTETTLTVPQYTEINLNAAPRPITPPPYSPPTAAVIMPLSNNQPGQQISSSNV